MFAELKALRRELADENNVPAYIVFSDATLMDMCKKLPTTAEELLEVSGVRWDIQRTNMKEEKFVELWNKHSSTWYNECVIEISNTKYPISAFCDLVDDETYIKLIHKKYEKIKSKVKELYFVQSNDCQATISPFKRASIIVYAVNSMEPILFKKELPVFVKNKYSLFLKQRLAFHIALQSIIMEYPEEFLNKKYEEGNLFDFDIVSVGVGSSTGDSFLKGIYKDIFYSEIYKNYNVITMSNIFLLIVERSSRLAKYFEENPKTAT